MDGKGREGTYNFLSRRLGCSWGPGHRAQGTAAPCHPAGAAHASDVVLSPSCLAVASLPNETRVTFIVHVTSYYCELLRVKLGKNVRKICEKNVMRSPWMPNGI